jgi:uncharacterized protein YdhG (YjbR/CyaY superfamily)
MENTKAIDSWNYWAEIAKKTQEQLQEAHEEIKYLKQQICQKNEGNILQFGVRFSRRMVYDTVILAKNMQEVQEKFWPQYLRMSNEELQGFFTGNVDVKIELIKQMEEE